MYHMPSRDLLALRAAGTTVGWNGINNWAKTWKDSWGGDNSPDSFNAWVYAVSNTAGLVKGHKVNVISTNKIEEIQMENAFDAAREDSNTGETVKSQERKRQRE
jgi:hypothetical protein